jgi:hypothetical protein
MIGYAPLLGQVRLASYGIGQATDIASTYEEQIRTLLNNARDLPNAASLMEHGNFCYAQAAVLRRASNPEEVARAKSDVEKCVQDLRLSVEHSLIAAMTSPASVPTAEGIPTWGYVIGGLAVAGIIAIIATS